MAKFKKGDNVRVLRNIAREGNKDYAKAGDKGTVLDVFSTTGGSTNIDETRWHAKIKIGNKVKTLRFTSLSKDE